MLDAARTGVVTLATSAPLLVELADVLQRPKFAQRLARAVAAQAEVIVLGDSDLLALESYEGIPIITAAQLMARITS